MNSQISDAGSDKFKPQGHETRPPTINLPKGGDAIRGIREKFAANPVNYQRKEYSFSDIHNNTADSFNAMLERAKQVVFHYLRKKHFSRYLHEIGFRWNQREPVWKKNRKGELMIIMKSLPVLTR